MWLALAAFAVPLSATAAPEVAVVKAAESLAFQLHGRTVAGYQFAGTVPVEKGTDRKPLAKPYWYPLGIGGTGVTRNWPMARAVTGDATDHFHQKSAWFCHGDVIPVGLELKTRSKDAHVKGVDFWSEAAGHGRIVCVSVGDATAGNTIATKNEWRTPDGDAILTETRTLGVVAVGTNYLLTMTSELSPSLVPVTFGDTKEGSFGLRIGEKLDLSRGAGRITSSDGTTAAAGQKDNLPLWGREADWHDYSGPVGGATAGVAIFDHPKNPHRAAWHTRAYGLMAANPFGRAGSGFPGRKGSTEPVKLARGETLTLRYAFYVHAGTAAEAKVAEAYAAYAR